jgi:hypothetical protein
VISATYVFPSESVSLLNCGVSSESIFTAKLWSQQRINSRCWIMVSATNQFLLPNCGVSSESVFAAEFIESTTNQFLLLKWGVSSELVFAIEFGVTSEPVSPTILYFSKSIPWQTCITNEPVSLTKFYSRLHIRTGSMIKMIALYDCNIWTLKSKHVCSWNLYGDELFDYRNANELICNHWCVRWCDRDPTRDRTRTSHERNK